MEIYTRYRDGIAILDIKGDVIGDGRFVLNKNLQEQVNNDVSGVILNLFEVSIMDSVALGLITAWLTSLLKKDGRLVLLNVGRNVKYLLVVEKLDKFFKQYDDEDRAIKSFGKKARK